MGPRVRFFGFAEDLGDGRAIHRFEYVMSSGVASFRAFVPSALMCFSEAWPDSLKGRLRAHALRKSEAGRIGRIDGGAAGSFGGRAEPMVGGDGGGDQPQTLEVEGNGQLQGVQRAESERDRVIGPICRWPWARSALIRRLASSRPARRVVTVQGV